MIRGVFVTGTGTGVGKTVLSAALLRRCRGAAPLRYWKPVQTGIEQDDDTAEVRRLAEARDGEIFDQGLRLERPVSPHLAAQWAGVTIDLARLRAMPPAGVDSRWIGVESRWIGDDARWIVEGAGGVLVPLNETSTMADFIRMLNLPALIAAESGLGTINHTLLTIEALRARSIAIAGVVLIGEPAQGNAQAIEHYGCTPVLAQMPRFDPLTPQTLGAWADAHFDPRGALGFLS